MSSQNFSRPTWKLDPKKRVAYTNARLYDAESGLDEKGALLTEGNTITDFGAHLFKDGVPEGIEVVDCGGHLLSPVCSIFKCISASRGRNIKKR